MTSNGVDLMTMAEGGASNGGSRSSRGSVADKYMASMNGNSVRTSAAEGELQELRRNSTGAKLRYEEQLATKEEVKGEKVTPPKKKIKEPTSPTKTTPTRASFTDPDLENSPRVKENAFLASDSKSRVNRPAKKAWYETLCSCFSAAAKK